MDESGHGGANDVHSRTFAKMLRDRSHSPSATIEAGYLSAMLCFAAEESIERKTQVDVASLPWDERIAAAI